MSLITQCPACSTMFRVVPDQLRISDGWVRCGQCQEVFDGHAHLCTPDAASPSPPETPGVTDLDADPLAPHDFSDTTDSSSFLRVDVVFPEDVSASAPAPDQASGLAPETLYEPASAPTPPPATGHEPDAALDFPQEPDDSAPEPESESEPAFEPVLEAALSPQPEPSVSDNAGSLLGDLTQEPEAAAVPLSFMAPPRPPSRFKAWMGTRAMLLLSTVLMVLLLGQVLVQQRDRLATMGPTVRAGLDALCEGLGCGVAPLKEIEAIAIDSSAFVSVKPGVYLLQVTLKSVAPTEVAVPALELTLTDNQDHPLLRRVISAEVHSPGPQVLAAGGELAIRVPLQLDAAVTADKVFGYKLLAFYP